MQLWTPFDHLDRVRYAARLTWENSQDVKETAYAYDANGNLTSGRDFTDAVAVASRAITYSPDGLPSRIVHNTGSSPLTTDFTYDGDGFRVKKTAGNRFTLYAGDYFEKSESGAAKFLFANGNRIAKIDSSGAYYFHQDHLGSTTVVSNAIGNAVAGESAEYKPFGGFRVALDSTVSNYRFTDQEFDPESNLYYYDARYYDPIIGRFVSADTVIPDYTDPQSLNRYSYVKNNPLMYVDPTGNFEVSVGWGDKNWTWNSDWVDGLFSNNSQHFTTIAPTPPPAPPGVNVNDNIAIAKDYSWLNPGALVAFYQNVQNYGIWDYKRQGHQYENFGNFNYGATAAAMGIPYYLAQNAAGIYQQLKGAAAAGRGTPVVGWPYGDDLKDAMQIKAGYDYFKGGYK